MGLEEKSFALKVSLRQKDTMLAFLILNYLGMNFECLELFFHLVLITMFARRLYVTNPLHTPGISLILLRVTLGLYRSGPGCSKLTTPLVNKTLQFQTLISQICQYFC